MRKQQLVNILIIILTSFTIQMYQNIKHYEDVKVERAQELGT